MFIIENFSIMKVEISSFQTRYFYFRFYRFVDKNWQKCIRSGKIGENIFCHMSCLGDRLWSMLAPINWWAGQNLSQTVQLSSYNLHPCAF